MAEATVIPVLPCRSLKETLGFYGALGFEVTHEQHAPYVYGAIEREGIHLHFFGSKHLPATESGHMALVMVSDVDVFHGTFSVGIKATYGKRLRTGIPRLGSVNSLSKDRRFNLLDPSGNRLIFIQSARASKPKTKPKYTSALTKAIQGARLDAYSRDEPQIAAKYLDQALENAASEPDAVRYQAFVLRADIAAMLADGQTLNHYVRAAQEIRLKDEVKAELAEAMQRLAELEAELSA